VPCNSTYLTTYQTKSDRRIRQFSGVTRIAVRLESALRKSPHTNSLTLQPLPSPRSLPFCLSLPNMVSGPSLRWFHLPIRLSAYPHAKNYLPNYSPNSWTSAHRPHIKEGPALSYPHLYSTQSHSISLYPLSSADASFVDYESRCC
jgi:hypothetical protein